MSVNLKRQIASLGSTIARLARIKNALEHEMKTGTSAAKSRNRRSSMDADKMKNAVIAARAKGVNASELAKKLTNTYSEKEASQMRCAGPVRGSLCVGSQCMAWRWRAEARVENQTGMPGAEYTVASYRGYCGLAGRPNQHYGANK